MKVYHSILFIAAAVVLGFSGVAELTKQDLEIAEILKGQKGYYNNNDKHYKVYYNITGGARPIRSEDAVKKYLENTDRTGVDAVDLIAYVDYVLNIYEFKENVETKKVSELKELHELKFQKMKEKINKIGDDIFWNYVEWRNNFFVKMYKDLARIKKVETGTFHDEGGVYVIQQVEIFLLPENVSANRGTFYISFHEKEFTEDEWKNISNVTMEEYILRFHGYDNVLSYQEEEKILNTLQKHQKYELQHGKDANQARTIYFNDLLINPPSEWTQLVGFDDVIRSVDYQIKYNIEQGIDEAWTLDKNVFPFRSQEENNLHTTWLKRKYVKWRFGSKRIPHSFVF